MKIMDLRLRQLTYRLLDSVMCVGQKRSSKKQGIYYNKIGFYPVLSG